MTKSIFLDALWDSATPIEHIFNSEQLSHLPVVKVTNSKHIAGLVGPTLIAMTISESEFIQPHLYDTQIAPVVYLSGTLLFVAGLAIVCVHNRWMGDWTVLITLIGWFAIFGGLFRMFATKLYQQGAQNTTALLVLELVLLAVGIFLTFKAYVGTKS
jgi:uncharacterized membrane protein